MYDDSLSPPHFDAEKSRGRRWKVDKDTWLLADILTADDVFSALSCLVWVERGAFLDFKKTQNVDKTGSTEANGFLLVLPGDSVPVAVGDKVLLGEGPKVTTREEWAALIPAKVPGLAVVKYVDPKYWKGRQVHVEAGG